MYLRAEEENSTGFTSWFYDRGAIKDRAHTGTSKGLSQVMNSGPIRKFQPKYANVYVTIQSHGLSAGVRTHYVTANGVRDGLARRTLRRDHSATVLRPAPLIGALDGERREDSARGAVL